MSISHGFELDREEFIPELNSSARLYRHLRSGAKLLSMINDDENKVFGITFRTPPTDSTGVPHIMEHSVLGGSRKYQVREPFVELLKGSLYTFLNAFTASDWTTYPVASTNLQDFYNLIDVYLDAVLYPLITPHHLDQEGWHYELNDQDGRLTYKGVVFNEMKGAYSSPDQIFGRYNQHSLFEGHIYGNDSGGDPQEIPNLTYDQFKAFHEKYYHPTNAYIFMYGDDDPEERLKILDDYLKDFEAIRVDSLVPLASRYSKPRHYSFPYIVDGQDIAKKARLQVNWLLPEGSDPNLTMALSILSYALVSTPASPLRKALIDSGLGEEITGGGLSGNLREMTFGVGLKGINLEDANQVEDLILTTLADISETGLEPEMIDAALNSIEFTLRERNTGGFPQGLGVMLAALSTWLYDHDPLIMLYFEEPMENLRKDLSEDAALMNRLVREYLMNNPHRTTVILEPDPNLAQILHSEEQARLEEVEQTLDAAKRQAIVENMKALRERQERPDSPEELAKIPVLTLDDLDKETKTIPITIETIQGAKLLYHDLFTNGILYLDAGFDLHSLPTELLPYVNLFGASLTKMGTKDQDFVRLTQRIRRETGGIWHSTMTSTTSDGHQTAAYLFIRGKATVAKAGELLDIYRDILLDVKLDNRDRFRQIVLEAKASEEAGLIQMGHVVARNRLASHLNEAEWVREQIDGINYLFFLNKLAEDVEANWDQVLENLELVRSNLVSRQGMIVNVTLDDDNYQTIKPQLTSFLSVLPIEGKDVRKWSPDLKPLSEGLTIPARVNYVTKGGNLYDLGYEFDGSISVISKLLRTSWLWEKVRVQGGAYGSGCLFNRHSGLFLFHSYRDPNLVDTLNVFDGTADFLRNVELSDDEIAKSIIGAIGETDTYQLPDAKGYTAMTRYLLGITDESRQESRDQILSTNVSDFRAFADSLAKLKEAGSIAVLGSAEAINGVNEDGWLQISKVM